jgi:hypothetical protein
MEHFKAVTISPSRNDEFYRVTIFHGDVKVYYIQLENVHSRGALQTTDKTAECMD